MGHTFDALSIQFDVTYRRSANMDAPLLQRTVQLEGEIVDKLDEADDGTAQAQSENAAERGCGNGTPEQ